MDEDSSPKSCGREVYEGGGRPPREPGLGSDKLSPAAGRPGGSGLPSGWKAVLCPAGR